MDSVYLTLVSKVNASGQLQLLRFWNELTPGDQLKLAEQILKLDLIGLNKMFKDAQTRRGVEDNIHPVDEANVGGVDHEPEVRQRWRQIGLEAIGRGEVGVILLSGGQGTRLGSDQPKALYDLGLPSKKTLLNLHADKISRLETMTGGKIPWYIMTSESTHQDITENLEKCDFYGLCRDQVKVFNQGTLPCLSDEGDILLKDHSVLAVSPDGNGGLYKALSEHGVLADMKLKNVKHLYVYCVDNVLVKIADPEFLGYCIFKEADCGNKVVTRLEDESVGVTCLIDGRPNVIEYTEIPDEIREAKTNNGKLVHDAANICIHYFSLDFLEKAVDKEDLLPVHLARKKIPHVTEAGNFVKPEVPNGVKLEKFVFDVFQFAEPDKFVIFKCDRNEEFAPLKNATGETCTPEDCVSKLTKLHSKWLLKAGAELVGPDGDSLIKEDMDKEEADKKLKNVKVEVSGRVSYDGDGLEKLVNGKMLSWPLHLSENKMYF